MNIEYILLLLLSERGTISSITVTDNTVTIRIKK